MLAITLRQLEYATATARFGGVTAAAEALSISQPALSVALAQLESTLGQPLFLRRPGGPVALTAFGRTWLAEAQAQLDALTRLMSGEVPSAPIRLACFEDLAPTLLAPLLRRIATAAPGLTVEPNVLPFEAIADGLRSGQIDLAITWDLGLDATVDKTLLRQVAPHAVAGADHPLAPLAKRGTTLAEVSEYPLILADQGLSLGHMRALFTARGLPFTVAHRTASIDLMRSFAANGLGLGLSYTRPAGRRSHDGAAIATVVITDAGTEPIILARLAANPPTPEAAQLAALVTDSFATPRSQPTDGDT